MLYYAGIPTSFSNVEMPDDSEITLNGTSYMT